MASSLVSSFKYYEHSVDHSGSGKNTLPANYKDILQEMQNRQLKQKEMLEELEQQGLGTK